MEKPSTTSIPPPPPPTPPPPNPNRSPTISKDAYPAALDTWLQKQDGPFTPCFMFFYGSLMDPEVLQAVLGLKDTPTVGKGVINGFSMKMWGIYPTLIHNTRGRISGAVWKLDSESHFLRLQEYETEAYTWSTCDIKLEDGEVLHGCRTFFWAGDPKSKDLKDGKFDLLRYQKYLKASVVRK